MNIKLIAGWQKAYKLYSVQIGILLMLVSIADIILKSQTTIQVPTWVFYLSGPGVMIARVIQQFFGENYGTGPNDPIQ